MKSIVNKVIYSLGGAFNIIGKELGHIYKIVSYAIAIITGKSMSINNTIEAPMRITLNPTAITQDGTPTPSTPEEIHIISGSNTITVNGKNLFDRNNANIIIGYFAASSNNVITSNTSHRTLYIQCEPNTTYTVSKSTDGGNLRFSIGTTTSTPQVGSTVNQVILDNDASSLTITTNANSNYLVVWYYNTNSTLTNDEMLATIQIEKNSTATTYTPYVSQTTPINLGEYELGTIGNYSNEFVRSGGKQLFDISAIEESKYINSGSGTTGTSSVSNLSDYIEVESGETYTLTYNYSSLQNSDSRGLCYFNSSKTYISGSSYNPTTKTYSLSIPSNAKYVRFAYDKNCYDIMLNKGTTALPYVPYEKGWYYKQGIGKATNNTISSGSSYSNIIYFSLPKPVDSLNYIWATRNTQFMYSKAQYSTSGNWNSADNIGKIVGGASEHIFWVGFPVGTTLAQAQELLANDTLYYIKATPTYTKITGELANQLEQVYKGMLSYDGTTNISQVNNDLAFELIINIMKKI